MSEQQFYERACVVLQYFTLLLVYYVLYFAFCSFAKAGENKTDSRKCRERGGIIKGAVNWPRRAVG